MLRHTVLFTLAPTADPAAVDDAVAALEGLPAVVPTVRSLVVRRDAGLADGTADLLLEATFDDEAGWRTYVEHPAHVAVVADHVRPLISGRTAIQTVG